MSYDHQKDLGILCTVTNSETFWFGTIIYRIYKQNLDRHNTSFFQSNGKNGPDNDRRSIFFFFFF